MLARQPEIRCFFAPIGAPKVTTIKALGGKWDVPLLEGYRFEFLPNWSIRPNASRFWGLINPRIILHLRRRKFEEGFAEVVTECSADALTSAIERVLLAPGHGAALRAKALEVFFRNHDIDRQRAQFRLLLQSLTRST
jgi:hypothetical protein